MERNIEIGVQLLEFFKEITGFSNEKFLNYMNTYNVWGILDDSRVIKGFIWADEEDILNIFGRFLSKDERRNIISRYNSRF